MMTLSMPLRHQQIGLFIRSGSSAAGVSGGGLNATPKTEPRGYLIIQLVGNSSSGFMCKAMRKPDNRALVVMLNNSRRDAVYRLRKVFPFIFGKIFYRAEGEHRTIWRHDKRL